MIKTLYGIDFDKTLAKTVEPEEGKKIWKDVMGEEYPYLEWWGRKESLDTDVFDISLYDSLVNIIKKEEFNENSYVIIITNRIEKLKPEIQNILNLNGVRVDFVDNKKNDKNKGDRILEYLETFPDLETINVYDDRPSNIMSYKNVVDKIPTNVVFNVYFADKGKLTLADSNNEKNILSIVREEIIKIFK